MAVALQLQPKGRAHGEGTDHQQGDAHKDLRPGGHGLTVGEAFDTGGDQGENNEPGEWPAPQARALRQASRGRLREKGAIATR